MHSVHHTLNNSNDCSYKQCCLRKKLNKIKFSHHNLPTSSPTPTPSLFLFFNILSFILLSLISTSAHSRCSHLPPFLQLPFFSHLFSLSLLIFPPPFPLTLFFSHIPFNTCQLLPVRLSKEQRKKVTCPLSIPLLLVLALLEEDGSFN